MFGIFRFRGGIHPPLEKERTALLPIEPLPLPTRVFLHLAQHSGSPATPVVKPGDRVRRGQILGEASTFGSAPIHASVAGTVRSIGQFPHPSGRLSPAIEIENDGSNRTVEMKPLEKPWKEVAPGEIIQKISIGGIVGMGGGAIPVYVKLSPPSNKPIETLIINGIECEPYLTADLRLMIEKPEGILNGALIIKKILGAKTVHLAVAPPSLELLTTIIGLLDDPKFKDISLVKIRSKYPQGSEQQLISTITGKQVPSGGQPMDIRCVVQNVATAYAVWNMVCNGTPLFERVVTVSGPAIASPKNLLVPIGTPLRCILDNCDINKNTAQKIVLGGAMMGSAQPDLDVPVLKSTSGILAFDRLVEGSKRWDCINCGNCVKTCPMRLVPSFLVKYIEKSKFQEAREWGVMDCIECGCCAYVCPSKINLVHFLKLGKYHVLQHQESLIKT